MLENSLPDSLVSTDVAMNYWQNVAPSVDGMLGGFPSVSRIDLQGSRLFLAKLCINNKLQISRALEVGAGIGRVTKVDTPGVGQIFNIGLQDWRPQPDVKYDLIWTQWCACQISDTLLVKYLQRCAASLSADGVIVLKENLSDCGVYMYDEVDSSVTRYAYKSRTNH
ncbi:hypothetical protein H9Q74_005086 [Fusarium xylarioides]|nr:hypothetical protein H9Q71_004919 [Fusarium xylarioides]KAG5824812.1 hypothetical protein H9Q74_005086 [Fusarium xylarioides]